MQSASTRFQCAARSLVVVDWQIIEGKLNEAGRETRGEPTLESLVPAETSRSCRRKEKSKIRACLAVFRSSVILLCILPCAFVQGVRTQIILIWYHLACRERKHSLIANVSAPAGRHDVSTHHLDSWPTTQSFCSIERTDNWLQSRWTILLCIDWTYGAQVGL